MLEREFVDWLVAQRREQSGVKLGIGDDAAVLEIAGSLPQLAVSTDSIADGVHFQSSEHSLSQIGHKAIAVSLSDMAAMGVRPLAATVSIFAPKSFSLTEMQKLHLSIQATADRFDVTIVGGDTNRWDGKLVVGTTLIGDAGTATEGLSYWTMSDAKAGDAILVSGKLGGSILNNHIDFEPRVMLALELARRFQINAATDITDSLALDLDNIATQSGCGFQLEGDTIPISRDAKTCSQSSGRSPLDHALYDGEDFELILCVAPEPAAEILSAGIPVTRIGVMTSDTDKLIRDSADCELRHLPIKGFEH